MNPLILVLVYEAGVQVKEWRERYTVYAHAENAATEMGVPLVVVGCPKFALHHGTGDVCIDLAHPFWCRCTNPVVQDVNNLGEMFAEKSIIVFTSHVLEHLEADEAVRVVDIMDRVAIAQFHCWPSKASPMAWLAPTHKSWPSMQDGELVFEAR